MAAPDPLSAGEVADGEHPQTGMAAASSDGAPPGVSGPPGLLSRLIRDRRVLFLFVGGLNTLIGTAWFALFDWALGARWNGFGHYPALVLTYVFAILCAFFLYRHLVFKVRGHVWADLLRFSSVYVSAFFINLVLLGVFVHVFHWPPFLSQCLIVFVTTTLSWVGHNRYSFRRPAPETTASDSGQLPTKRGHE